MQRKKLTDKEIEEQKNSKKLGLVPLEQQDEVEKFTKKKVKSARLEQKQKHQDHKRKLQQLENPVIEYFLIPVVKT